MINNQNAYGMGKKLLIDLEDGIFTPLKPYEWMKKDKGIFV